MTAAAPDPTDENEEPALAERVRAERLRFVFLQSALALFQSPIAAAILTLGLWHTVDHRRLLAWLGGLLMLAGIRMVLVRRYPATPPTGDGVKRWERAFISSILLVDVWWGIGALFLLPAGAPAERTLVFSFLMLMAGAHAATYAAHPLTVTAGVLAFAVPITALFLTENDPLYRALGLGAIVYLAATFRSIRALGFFFGRTHRLAYQLEQEKRRAEALARTDVLTELNNRRAFYELGHASLRLAERHARPTSFLMLDIDHFKQVNDGFGHAAGDAVLERVGRLLREEQRSGDITGRVGGEEFAVLLPETSLDAARAIAERLRARLAEPAVSYDGHELRFTVSIGVAELRSGETLEALSARADAALYDAKHRGRNRVEVS